MKLKLPHASPRSELDKFTPDQWPAAPVQVHSCAECGSRPRWRFIDTCADKRRYIDIGCPRCASGRFSACSSTLKPQELAEQIIRDWNLLQGSIARRVHGFINRRTL